MYTIYKNGFVKIINREFQNDAGIVFPQTAIVTLYNETTDDGETSDYGFLPTEAIYDLLDDVDNTINLDNCYVENFSLTAYRCTRLIHKKDIVKLKGFSAKNALFNSKFEVDFSYADFMDTSVSFYGAYFLNGELNFYRSYFGKGNVDFNSAVFAEGRINFAKIKLTKGIFNFKNTISGEGLINFEDSELGDGDKQFSNANFGGGDVRFFNVNFGKGKAHFKLVQFGDGLVDFHFSTFNNDFITFESSVFGNGNVDFSRVEFGKGKVNFNRTIFRDGDISFEGAIKRSGKLTMKWVKFGTGNVNFERIEMKSVDVELDKSDFDKGSISRVSFNRAKVNRLSLRSCHLDDYFDLRVAECTYMDLSNTVARDIIDIKTYDYKVKIKTLDIAHMRLLGVIDLDWYENNVCEIIKNKEEKEWIKADEFRTLKENFNKIGRYTDEDKAYVEFKRFEQKAILKDAVSKNKLSALWEYPYYYMKVLIFDSIGLYATNPVRVMFSMIVAYIIFSLIYAGLTFANVASIVSGLGGDHDLASVFGRAFYFSAITFLTIGYGDFYPMGCFRWISSIEGFTGVFLMSYFTVAFVRKILR